VPGEPAVAPPPLARFTRVVVAVLVVDALVLGAVGLYARRPLFVGLAGLALLLAGLARRMERGYRRRLAEIAAARRELRDEVRAIAGDLRQAPTGDGTSADVR
jgi:hypothetical protein